jgi:hypothetical protein
MKQYKYQVEVELSQYGLQVPVFVFTVGNPNNLTKIWCKFDTVIFIVKRVPVFRIDTIKSRDVDSFKKPS